MEELRQDLAAQTSHLAADRLKTISLANSKEMLHNVTRNLEARMIETTERCRVIENESLAQRNVCESERRRADQLAGVARELMVERQELNDKLTSSEKMVQGLRNQLAAHAQEIETERPQHTSLLESKSSIKKQMDRLNQDLEKSRQETEALVQRVSNVTAANTSLSAELNNAQREHAELQGRLASEERLATEGLRQQSHAPAQDVEEQLREEQEKSAQLSAALDQARTRLEDSLAHVHRLETEVGREACFSEEFTRRETCHAAQGRST